jgi:hypothetical protein
VKEFSNYVFSPLRGDIALHQGSGNGFATLTADG